MNKKHLFALLFTLLVWTSCNNQQHFITDAAYRAEVENDFQAKQAALPNGNLFAVFNDQMTPEEKGGVNLHVRLYADWRHHGL